jgi:hypothetical protein
MAHEYISTVVANLGSFTINAPNTIAFAPGTKIRARKLMFVIHHGQYDPW